MVAAMTRPFAVFWTNAILDDCTRHLDGFVQHVIDLDPSAFVSQFRRRNNARRAWAKKNNKPTHTDAEITEQLAFANPPLPETSKYLLECLANVQFLPEN
jgi:chloramphenicol 3-O-phosphotransferase